jgi:hypothetical protein
MTRCSIRFCFIGFLSVRVCVLFLRHYVCFCLGNKNKKKVSSFSVLHFLAFSIRSRHLVQQQTKRSRCVAQFVRPSSFFVVVVV